MPATSGSKTNHSGDQPSVFLAMRMARATVSPNSTVPEVGSTQPHPRWPGWEPRDSGSGASGGLFTMMGGACARRRSRRYLAAAGALGFWTMS